MQNQFGITCQSSYRVSPKYSFTSAPASKEHARNYPGPGAYGVGVPADRDKFRKSASFTMGGSGRDGKPVGAMPGPGAYKPEGKTLGGTKVVFSGEERLRVKKQSPTPGPGAYFKPGAPGGSEYTITGKPEGTKKQTAPGPGSYQPSYASVTHIETIPKVSFGASKRSDMVLAKSPGPGAYNHDNFMKGFKNSTSYSIAGKYEPPAPDTTPGPMQPHTQFK